MGDLTVAVTYFDEGPLLTRCLESLLANTSLPEEILVFDDASPSRSAAEFVPSDSRIRVVRSELNVGPSQGRNRLLEEARGEWIHFHDADDWFEPHWVEQVRKKMDSADVIFTEVKSFRDGVLFRDRVIGWDEHQNQSLTEFALSHFVLVPSGTYRRKLMQELGGFPSIRQSEDFALSLELGLKNPAYVVLPESLVCIDLRGEGRSRQNASEPWEDALRVLIAVGPRLMPTQHDALASAFGRVGAKLFELDQVVLAREAFRIGARYGRASFANRTRPYQWVARVFGPMTAERLGAVARKLRP